MKLYELNFTLLREFKELKGLFDLFNQMIVTNGNHSTLSVKSDKDVYFIEISLYGSSEIPLIVITRDLQTCAAKDIIPYSSSINDSNMFLKFNVKDSKHIQVEVFDTIYEYVPEIDTASDITPLESSNFEELFNFDLKVNKSFSQIAAFVNTLNAMLSNDCFSFAALRNKLFAYNRTVDKRNITMNFFTTNILRPSVFFNATLYNESNSVNITKYNMLCSQEENDVRISINIKKQDKHLNTILKVRVYLPKNSQSYDKIKEQCKLIDLVSCN